MQEPACAPREHGQDGLAARYRIVRHIGSGGMAEVYLADDVALGRRVVIKRMAAHLATNPTAVSMFLDEARVCALLDHPSIVKFHELGRDPKCPFMVLEWLDGCELQSLMDASGGTVDLGVAVYLIAHTCRALHAAHTARTPEGDQLNLVHRDVSPRNLVVTTEGHLKVLDFGVAKTALQQTRTLAGQIKGKLAYMAPEQLTGGTVDGRTDVYAAGVVLHELITGRLLFREANLVKRSTALSKSSIPPPTRAGHEIPAALADAVMQALARSPDERFSSALAMAERLEAIARQHGMMRTAEEVANHVAAIFSQDPPWICEVQDGEPQLPTAPIDSGEWPDIALHWTEPGSDWQLGTGVPPLSNTVKKGAGRRLSRTSPRPAWQTTGLRLALAAAVTSAGLFTLVQLPSVRGASHSPTPVSRLDSSRRLAATSARPLEPIPQPPRPELVAPHPPGPKAGVSSGQTPGSDDATVTASAHAEAPPQLPLAPSADSDGAEPQACTHTPRIVSVRRMRAGGRRGSARLRVRWRPVPGAVGYQVQRSRAKDFGNTRVVAQTRQPNAVLKSAPLRQSYVRVRALVPSVESGCFSKVRRLAAAVRPQRPSPRRRFPL